MRVCENDGCEKKHLAKGYCHRHYYQLRNHGKITKTIYDKSYEERFFQRINSCSVSECWEWVSTLDGNGYGEFRIKGRLTKAHRFSYEIHIGKIPAGLSVLHKCDTPKCVNPNHLFLGTQCENVHDMINKKRLVANIGEKNGNSVLKNEDILKIKRMIADGLRNADIAKNMNMNATHIRDIRLGKIWSHIKLNNN